MKKSFKIIVLIVVLAVFLLMAIGSGSSDSEKEDSKPASSASSKPSSSIKDKGDDDKSETKKEDKAEKADPTASYTIDNEVLVENDDCKITITGVEIDNIWGFKLKALVENFTDKNLMFTMDDVSINGYMIDPFWAEDVAAGKKSNTSITFSNDDIEEAGIDTADEITFKLRVYDNDDWLADHLVDDEFTIYPTGLTHDDIKIPERRTTSKEKVIVDDDKCTFVILEENPDDTWGYELKAYVENKTDDTLVFGWDDTSINGFMISIFYGDTVSPHKRAYSDITVFNSDLEENNIEKVEEIEFNFYVYNDDNWGAGRLVDDVYTYEP